jgi:hypothetical protein
VRNDAAEAHARVEESEARKALVQQLCDQVGAMQDRINALADELEARHRADARVAARQAETRMVAPRLHLKPIHYPLNPLNPIDQSIWPFLLGWAVEPLARRQGRWRRG